MANSSQELKVVKKDLAEIKTILADQVQEAVANTNEKSEEIETDMKVLAQQAGKNVRAFLGGKKEQVGAAKEKVSTTIQERPFTSAAVAFAGGVLLTTLIKKK